MPYKSSESVSSLDYDFKPYAEISGVTPEPSDKHMEAYWEGYQKMLREQARDIADWQSKQEALKPDDVAGLRALDDDFDAWQAKVSSERRSTRKGLLAAVCQNKPSYEELDSLPGRVFDDFESYMHEELTPKGRRSAGT